MTLKSHEITLFKVFIFQVIFSIEPDSGIQVEKTFRIFMYFRSSEPQEFKINSHHQQISRLRSSRQISTLSRALALAGCDRSERASVGKVSRPPHPSLRFFRDFVLCQVRGHLVRLATTSSAFPPNDAETMRLARSPCGVAVKRKHERRPLVVAICEFIC